MLTKKGVSEILKEHSATIITDTEIGPLFWASLEKRSVVNPRARVPIEAGINNYEKMDKLLEHIRKDIVARFDGFILALDDTEQTSLAELLREAKNSIIPDEINDLDKHKDLNDREIENLLVKKGPKLMSKMKVNDALMSYLERERVVIDLDVDHIMSSDSNYTKKARLLDHIRKNPKQRFQGLLVALAGTNQNTVITDILGQPVPTLDEVEDD